MWSLQNPTLTNEEERLMHKMLSDFERNGLALPADKRAQLAQLLKKVHPDVLDLTKHHLIGVQ